MQQTDLCKYVDVFFGNGETDRFFEDGLASKWFYIKALCGNTIPHAVLPFGKMSVGAYSGGYPTGYGMHYPNSCGGLRKTGDIRTAKGFFIHRHTCFALFLLSMYGTEEKMSIAAAKGIVVFC